jgi:C_GCAxxG_C_C family probable redox protein
MSEAVKKALEYHAKGYNCAQSVACAFCDRLGKDEKTVFEMTEAFGFGMGTMGTCGAVSAMAAVVGMVESDGNLEAPKTKKKSYGAMKELTNKFIEKNESIICKDIKGVETGKVLRSCNGCIEDAVVLLEEYLASKGE